MTTHYQSNDGILTNNDSESYNARMRKKIGNHPNLPTVIGVLREENTLVEIDWLQRDRDNSTQRRELREKLEQIQERELKLTLNLTRGIMEDEIVELRSFISRLLRIR